MILNEDDEFMRKMPNAGSLYGFTHNITLPEGVDCKILNLVKLLPYKLTGLQLF